MTWTLTFKRIIKTHSHVIFNNGIQYSIFLKEEAKIPEIKEIVEKVLSIFPI